MTLLQALARIAEDGEFMFTNTGCTPGTVIKLIGDELMWNPVETYLFERYNVHYFNLNIDAYEEVYE